jgi:gas vesicle structural protein
VDARIVITSVDTDLRLAEAVNRLDLTETRTKGLTELIGDTTQGAAKRRTARAIDAVMERLSMNDIARSIQMRRSPADRS